MYGVFNTITVTVTWHPTYDPTNHPQITSDILWREFKTYSHIVNFSLRSQRTLLSLKCSKTTK